MLGRRCTGKITVKYSILTARPTIRTRKSSIQVLGVRIARKVEVNQSKCRTSTSLRCGGPSSPTSASPVAPATPPYHPSPCAPPAWHPHCMPLLLPDPAGRRHPESRRPFQDPCRHPCLSPEHTTWGSARRGGVGGSDSASIIPRPEPLLAREHRGRGHGKRGSRVRCE